MPAITELTNGIKLMKRDGNSPTSTGGGGVIDDNFKEIAQRIFAKDAGGNRFDPNAGHNVNGSNNLYFGKNNGTPSTLTPTSGQIWLGSNNTLPQMNALTLANNRGSIQTQRGWRAEAFAYADRATTPILEVVGPGFMACRLRIMANHGTTGIWCSEIQFGISNYMMSNYWTSGLQYSGAYDYYSSSSLTYSSTGPYYTLKMSGRKLFVDMMKIGGSCGSSSNTIDPQNIFTDIDYATFQGVTGPYCS